MKSSAISIRSSAAGNWQRQSICFGCQKGAVISQLASWLTGIYSWETITLDFGSAGKAILDKSLVVDQGLGKFFNFSDDILK